MSEIDSYSAKEASHLLGVPLPRIRAWIRLGLVRPDRDAAGAERLSFQQMVVLRQAQALTQRSRPPGRARTLRWLADHARLEGPGLCFSLDVAEGRVVLRDGHGIWRADDGQGLLELEAGSGGLASPCTAAHEAPAVGHPVPSALPSLRWGSESGPDPGPRPDPALASARDGSLAAGDADSGGAQIIPWPGPRRKPTQATAEGCLAEAEAVERQNPEAALALYRRALELEPACCEAHLNLGRLLHEQRHFPEAELHYRTALSLVPKDATAAYNLGVLLEDQALLQDALWWYEAALAADPGHADAHFNAARLCEQLGQPLDAVRHLTAYRRLTRGR